MLSGKLCRFSARHLYPDVRTCSNTNRKKPTRNTENFPAGCSIFWCFSLECSRRSVVCPVNGAANIPGDPPEPQGHPQGDGFSCTMSALQSSLFPLPVSQAQGEGKDLLSNGSLLIVELILSYVHFLAAFQWSSAGTVDITRACTCLLPLPELGNCSAGSEAAVPPLSPFSVPSGVRLLLPLFNTLG